MMVDLMVEMLELWASSKEQQWALQLVLLLVFLSVQL